MPANPNPAAGSNPAENNPTTDPITPGPHTPDQSEAILEQQRQIAAKELAPYKGEGIDLRGAKPKADEPAGDIEIVLLRELTTEDGRLIPAGQAVFVTKAFFSRAIAPHPGMATTVEAAKAKKVADDAAMKAQRVYEEAASKAASL